MADQNQSGDKRGSTPSHAQAVSLDGPKDAGARLDGASRDLRSQYERARSAQLDQKTQAAGIGPSAPVDRNTPQPSPSMSHARSVQMDGPGRGGQLESASQSMRAQFERARQAQLNQAARPGAQQAPPAQARPGSEMVRNDRPQHEARPPESMRKEPDRQAYDEKMARDRAQAKALNDRLKARGSEPGRDYEKSR